MRVPICLLATLLVPALGAADPIYKTYDEEGNPVYTDQQPDDNAEPMDLPELHVLEGRETLPDELVESSADEAAEIELAFESPVPGQDIVSTDDMVPVRLSSSIDLPGTTLMVIYLNDRELPAAPGLATEISEVPVGENRIRAEIQTEAGRVLAATDEVTFNLHQATGQPDRD